MRNLVADDTKGVGDLAYGIQSADRAAQSAFIAAPAPIERWEASIENAMRDVEEAEAAIDSMSAAVDDQAVSAGIDAEALSALRDKTAEVAEAQQAAAAETEAAGGASEGLGGGHPLVAGLLAIALALGPAFIAAAAGEAIFAGAAIPDIEDIIHNTGAFKGDLDEIKSEYLQLAAAVKPEVIADFDDALLQAKAILPEFTGVAQAGGVALGDFLNQFGNFLQSGDSKEFLAFVQQAAGPDVHAFGNLIQGAATAVMGFSESLNGISQTLINVAGGLLSFGGEILKEVPWLGQWAVGIGAMYFASAKLPELIEKIISSNFLTWLVGGEAGIEAMTAAFIAEDGSVDVLAGSLAVLDAINPFVWVAAGIVAIGALGSLLVDSSESISDVTDKLKDQYGATGYSTQGWDNYAKALNTNVTAQQEVAGAFTTTFAEMHDGITATQQVASTASQAAAQASNLSSRLGQLSSIFGVSQAGAIQLAEGAKVTAAELAATGDGRAEGVREGHRLRRGRC